MQTKTKIIRVVTKKPGMVNVPKVENVPVGLDSMQKLVDPDGKLGAFVEVVRLPELAPHGIDLWVNEEGKFNGCRPNFMIFGYRDTVMGPVFFASSDDEGETVGLTDAQIEIVLKFLREVPQSIF